MRTIKTILFDLDGTLVDTNEVIVQSYQEAFKTHFVELSFSKAEIVDLIGPPLRTIFNRFTDQTAKVDQAIETYLGHYKSHEHDLFSLYPDVIKVLKTLKTQGYRIGIVTSKFSKSAMPSVEHFNLMPYFDTFVALEDVKAPKPDPEGVLLAMDRLQAEPENTIMIGDNQSDILAGQNAGVYTAGVAWSIKGKQHLNDVNPDYMLETMNDLLKIINRTGV